MFESKPDRSSDATSEMSDAETADIVADIESIVDWENAGFVTDWTAYPFWTKQLVVVWRNAEAEIDRLHTMRFQAVLKGFLK